MFLDWIYAIIVVPAKAEIQNEFMKFLLQLFFIIFLSACVSGKKQAYDSVNSNPAPHRNLSAISPLISPFESEGNSFEFIASQMKKVVSDYERMKNQLAQINIKLDQALNKLALYELKHLFPADSKQASTPLEDQITLHLKNDEEFLFKITKQEDYRQLIGQIIVGDFDIDEEEKERLLTLLKNKVNPEAEDSLEEESEPLEEDSLENQDSTQKVDVFLFQPNPQKKSAGLSIDSTKTALSLKCLLLLV